jgi:ATP-binding cassette, subfamily B, bacterial
VDVRDYWLLLARYLRPFRGQVVVLGLLLAASIALQLINPQVLRFFIDTTQAGGVQDAILWAALLFLLVGISERAIRFASVYLGGWLGWQTTNALRADLASHCLSLDMSFHKQRTPGELIERIDGDVSTLGEFFSQLTVILIANVLLALGIVLLTYREDWRVGLGVTVYAVLSLGTLGAVQKLAIKHWMAYRQSSSTMLGFLEERLAGAEDLRASGAEQHTLRQFEALLDKLMRNNRAARLISNITFLIGNGLLYIGYGLGLAVGALLYLQGEVSIGSAFLLVYYVGMLSAPLDRIRNEVQALQTAGASIARVNELFSLRPTVTEQVRANLPKGPLAVEFAGVGFGYKDGALTTDDRPPPTEERLIQGGDVGSGIEELSVVGGRSALENAVLDGIDFRVAPGKVLGLLGRTGSGKTTLTRLLFRLYDPTKGTIRLGGVDIRELSLAELRSAVGIVTQDVQLFQASVRDNLTFFDSSIDDGQIWAALGELGLDNWVRSLPEGLDTKLLAGGAGLSAGEGQLLAFARVFLKNPGLVILDEASSRLDPATEQLIERAISRLLRDRTAVIIAHRLGTLQRADEILILEEGRIVEYGPRLALSADQGSRFAGLLQVSEGLGIRG